MIEKLMRDSRGFYAPALKSAEGLSVTYSNEWHASCFFTILRRDVQRGIAAMRQVMVRERRGPHQNRASNLISCASKETIAC
jgi:hypothetical protein